MLLTTAVPWLIIFATFNAIKVVCSFSNGTRSLQLVTVEETDVSVGVLENCSAVDMPGCSQPRWNETLTIPEDMDFKDKLIYFETLACPNNYLCDPIKHNHSYQCSPFWCYGCSCEDCDNTRDCCPDVSLQRRDREEDISNLTTCITSTLKSSENNKVQWFRFVNTCPKTFTDFETIAKCEHAEYDFNNVLKFIPAYSNGTQLNYINQFCARCNNDAASLVFWKPLINCSKFIDTTDASSAAAFLQIVWGDDFCSLVSLPPDEAVYVPCNSSRNIINNCNETGLWHQQDKATIEACRLYRSVVVVDEGRTIQIYRNIFCAICNGLTIQAIVDKFNQKFHCGKKPLDERQLGSGVSFSMLFNLSPKIEVVRREETTQKANECNESQVYDPYSYWCRPIKCTPGRVIENHSCVGAFPSGKHIGYKTLYWVFPNQTVLYPKDEIDTLWNNYMSNIVVQNIFPHMYVMMVYHAVEFYICYDGDLSDSKARINHLEVVNRMSVGSELSQEYTENFVSNFMNHTWNFADAHWMPEMQNHDPENVCVNLSYYKRQFKFSLPEYEKIAALYMKLSSEFFIPLTRLTNCTSIELNATEYIYDSKTGQMELTQTKEVIQREEYLLSGDTIRMCVNFSGYFDVIKAKERQRRVSSALDSIEVLLTFFFLLLSIVCLFVTFIVCLVINVSQTTPGKITVILVLSLLIAQVLYLVSGYPLGSLWPCRIMGLAVHLSWLIVFTWKNIAAFHMYAVFTRPLKMAVTSQTRIFSIYCLYGFLGPICLLGSYTLAQTLLSGGDFIGYGDRSCFLTRPLDIGLAFIAPVALVILTNTFFFARTVRAIQAMTEIERNSNKNSSNQNSLFMKMSIMLGFTWTIGFLANIIRVKYIWYVFIVLNGGIGVLVFVSQICSRQVFKLLRARFSSGKDDVSTSSKSITTDIHRNVTSTKKNSPETDKFHLQCIAMKVG